MKKLKILLFIILMSLSINVYAIEFDLNSQHAILYNLNDNSILYEKSSKDKTSIASMTKIMTGIVAIENIENLDNKVKLTYADFAGLAEANAAVAGFRIGEEVTYKDLLYGLMLPSGNDSAIAIAEQVSGSVEKFVELMNEEARKLGATNTHFVNPHGYHDKEHYTTAYDLYLMLNACIKDERFIDIISSKKWSTVITQKDGSTRAVTWNQSNRFINGNRETPHGITMIGGKTGTTYEAGYCLTQYGKDSKDTPYISMIMGATSSRNLYDNMTFLWAAIPD